MSLESAAIRDDFQAFLRRMADAFRPFLYLQSQEIELRLLADSLSSPFTLAVFGRMKTGKSSLINALIGMPLAITGVEEATATLNWISYGDASQQGTVVVHWKDGRVDPIPISRLSEWAGKEKSVLERVGNTAFLQLYANAIRLKDVQIVDTPGTGSVASEHEHVAREFLSPRASTESQEEGRRADALLYVFPPVGRERDEEALAEFRGTRLPGSDPYNSIGVLHKWDGLESDDITADAMRKAERLRTTLSEFVCNVIPVSAPLGMIARHAPDGFLEGILHLTTCVNARDDLRRSLKRDSRWDEDEDRLRARASYSLPWVSFVRAVRLLMDRDCDSVAAARSVCLEASGIQVLEGELDTRFFRRAALIKQRLTRVKAERPVKMGLMGLTQRIEQLSIDHRQFLGISSRFAATDVQGNWLRERASSTERERSALEECAVRANREWLVEDDSMHLMESDLALLEQLDKTPSMVEEVDRAAISSLIASSGQADERERIPSEVLVAMLARYQPRVNASVRRMREHFEHLTLRLQEQLRRCSSSVSTASEVHE